MESSDCESDLGASPSVTSDSSPDSSSCESSSPPVLKIVTPQLQQTARKLNQTTGSCSSGTPSSTQGTSSASTTLNSTPGTSMSSTMCSTPSSAKRKPVKKRYLNMPLPVTPPPEPEPSCSTKVNPNDKSPTSASSPTRKKRSPTKLDSSLEKTSENGNDSSKLSSPEKKRRRNKRRRTRSERNLLAGKTVVPLKTPAEGEEAIALCEEIDKALEEKRIKNNLSATNVKSILHHVITNNWVQKMVMSAVKKKAAAGSGGGDASSDDDMLLEPKMTRAKTKELWENSKLREVWPIVDSPGKKSKEMSETHILIHNDLPEDSSGDEEYVPVEGEADATHTDDESGSVTSSHASDVGSPVVTPKQSRVSTRRSVQADQSPFNDSMFKTPPPRPTKPFKLNAVNSGVSLRTRSKLPLNDTPLEDLERQLVPPDITEDMYEWGTATDNEDYLNFLNDFLNPGRSKDANEIDDDADPEYNIMEDDEDVHDKEELRMDRAVKVPKKELTQLMAELFESGGIPSGDDMDYDLATLTGITPFASDLGLPMLFEKLGESSANTTVQTEFQTSTVDASVLNLVSVDSIPQPPQDLQLQAANDRTAVSSDVRLEESNIDSENPMNVMKVEVSPVFQAAVPPDIKYESNQPEDPHVPPYFRDCDLEFLQHQIRQHIQLLTQSYVLTATSEDSKMKLIASSTRAMVIELRNFASSSNTSYFSVCNLESAWNIVNIWPHKYPSQSPIKKKILEDTYISEIGKKKDIQGCCEISRFPRALVKVLTENTAFLYNDLLPESFDLSVAQGRATFSCHEDAFLLCAMDDTKHLKKFSINQFAVCVSELLFGVFPAHQIYHRVRNLRKTSGKYASENARRYFADGVLPDVDRTVPYLTQQNVAPLLQRDRTGLSSQWRALLNLIEDSPSNKWEEKLRKDPVTSSIDRKLKTKQKQRTEKKAKAATVSEDGVESVLPSIPYSQTITKVFPQGVLAVDANDDPNMASIPIMGANGVVGAIIKVPKLALVAPTIQQPMEAVEAIGTAARPGTSSITMETFNIPTAQAQCTRPTNMITLDHLTRRAAKTPIKKNPLVTIDDSMITEGRPEFKVPLPLPPRSETPEMIIPDMKPDVQSPSKSDIPRIAPVQQVYNVIQVSQPFYLPELDTARGSQIIDLATLRTPLKNKILERATASELLQSVEASNVEDVPKQPEPVGNESRLEQGYESDNPDSPNVIEEGTEVELSDDDDDGMGDEEGVDLQCYETPELITLTSEDEEDYRQSNVTTHGDGAISSPKTNDNATGNTTENTNTSSKEAITCGSTNQSSASSSGKKLGRSGNGDESDEDGERKVGNRKRPLPKDFSGDEEQENEKQPRLVPPEMPAPPPPSQAQSSQMSNAPGSQQIAGQTLSTPQCNSTKHQKKARRSPGGSTGAKNRGVTSKYNVTPPEKLIEESPTGFDDVADAYMENYLARVMSATEANPSIYPTFVQTLSDSGETSSLNQSELHSKVKALFKDYPDLLQEFESFLEPSVENRVSESTTGNHLVMAEINIIEMVDRYTENCPALKAKILSKLKTLKEKSNLTEKDLANALEPLFVGNPVMMEAFKAILPSVYCPQSVTSSMDFEVLDLELDGDDPTANTSNEEMHFETVQLPEEKTVPATSTCPCVCHVKTSDPNFQLRNKHCRKCSLKFQDGRIYYHNGRGMRPVSVELHPATSPVANTKSVSQSATTPPIRSSNVVPVLATNIPPEAPSRTRKDSNHQHNGQNVKSKECSSKKEKDTEKRAPPLTSPSNLVASTSGTTVSVKPLPPQQSCTDESKEVISEESKTRDTRPANFDQPKEETQHGIDNDEDDWTQEEDVQILTICQETGITGEASDNKMTSALPHRSLHQLKQRRDELIELLKMESPDIVETLENR